MRALGRILQFIGWLWLFAGIFGPRFGLLDVGVPVGLILIFVARVIRNQAERTEMPELGEETSQTAEAPEPVRETRPEPREETPSQPVRPTTRYRSPAPEREPTERSEEGNDLLERIVRAGREVDDEMTLPQAGDESTTSEDMRRPMSSAEMIARAHERWDSKGRER